MEKKRYRNFDINQAKIVEAYDKYIKDTSQIPSFRKIAELTSLSYVTIERHFKHLNLDDICKSMRVHTPRVLDAIRKSAEAGKPYAQKLYLQVVDGYVEKREEKRDILGELNLNATHSGEINVVVQKRIINSRGDLEKIESAVRKAIKETPAVEDTPEVDNSPGKKAPVITINQIDTAIILDNIKKSGKK